MRKMMVFLLAFLLAFTAFPPGMAKAAAPTIAQIDVGLNDTAVLMSNGDLYLFQAWNDPWLQLESGFAQVALGDYHTLALKKDGSLYAKGYNDCGQMGNGTNEELWGLEQVGTGFTQIAAGSRHSLGLKGDKLYAWGSNQYGQLGDNSTTNRNTPVLIGTGFTQIAAAGERSAALKGDALYVWGWCAKYESGGFRDAFTPELVGRGFTKVATGDMHTLALKGDELYAFGRNDDGQLGDGTDYDYEIPVLIGSGYSQIVAGKYNSFAIATNGNLYGWGNNECGELGDGTTVNKNAPVLIGTGYTQIAASMGHTRGIKGGSLYRWGDITHESASRYIPNRVGFFDTLGQDIPPTGIALNATAKSIAVGETFTLSATISPSNATNKGMTWSSSNAGVASVTQGGIVKGIKAGSATITVATDQGGKTASCAVTVKKADAAVTSVAIPQKTVYLKKGASAKLAAVPVTPDGSKPKLTWKSSAPTTVSVDKNGKVKALKAGKATITAKAANGKSAKITVSVGGAPAKSVTIKNPPKNKTMKVGATLKLNITPSPKNAQGVLSFKSSNGAIIFVDAAGQLKALKKGNSTITVTLGGKKATLKITVK